jgi:hypothetical protein
MQDISAYLFLPEAKRTMQERMVEDLQDEPRWDELFKRTRSQLAVAAQRARQQIAAGMATPINYEQP